MAKFDKPGSKKTIYYILALSILFNIAFTVYGAIRYIRSKRYGIDNISYDGNRHKMYKVLPVDSNDNVFMGDSHIYKFNLHEFFETDNLKNRGIDGDTSPGLYYRLDDVLKHNPKSIFIEIGVNDIKTNIPTDSSSKYLSKIINKIQLIPSVSKFYFIGILPSSAVDNNQIVKYNTMLKNICDEKDVKFINAYPHFLVNGKLNQKLDCGDGLHLSADGYHLLAGIIKPYLN